MLVVFNFPDGSSRDPFEIEMPIVPLKGEVVFIHLNGRDVTFEVKKRDFSINGERVHISIDLKY